MKVGISRNSAGKVEASALIGAAMLHGFEGIQFKTSQLREWGFDPEILLKIEDQVKRGVGGVVGCEGEIVKGNARDMGGGGVVFHPGGDFGKWEFMTDDVLRFVQRVGGEHVCYCFAPEGNQEEVASQLLATGQRFMDAGVAFSFHNHVNTIVCTLEEVGQMCELLDPSVCGLTFDTAHAALGGMDDLGKAIRQLGRWITNVHLKDLDEGGGGSGGSGGRGFCPLGQGELDLSPALEALREMDYQHWLIVDEESPNCTADKACELSANYLIKHGVMKARG